MERVPSLPLEVALSLIPLQLSRCGSESEPSWAGNPTDLYASQPLHAAAVSVSDPDHLPHLVSSLCNHRHCRQDPLVSDSP